MSNAIALTQSMNLPAPSDSLDAYLRQVRQIPVLSVEDERELAVHFRDQNDLAAARKLVVSHLRFVVHIARGYKGYGLPMADLIQEGGIGLMKAVKRFDPTVGVRLVSFAVHWIRAEMHEFILRNWRIVKIATTKAQRKLFFNLRSSKKRLGWFSQEEVENVANDLGVTPENVLEMEKRLSGQDISFDPLDSKDDDDHAWTPSAYLQTENSLDPAKELEASDWSEDSRNRLNEALSQLDERSQVILQKRWLAEEKTTLHELARQYSISAERIRQLESNAIKKLQKMLVA
ncbi:MAG: RNA polymerase sigma factor RpoH [Gammaproteobacteria bacterium]